MLRLAILLADYFKCHKTPLFLRNVRVRVFNSTFCYVTANKLVSEIINHVETTEEEFCILVQRLYPLINVEYCLST